MVSRLMVVANDREVQFLLQAEPKAGTREKATLFLKQYVEEQT
jgi:hypothetical protein